MRKISHGNIRKCNEIFELTKAFNHYAEGTFTKDRYLFNNQHERLNDYLKTGNSFELYVNFANPEDLFHVEIIIKYPTDLDCSERGRVEGFKYTNEMFLEEDLDDLENAIILIEAISEDFKND